MITNFMTIEITFIIFFQSNYIYILAIQCPYNITKSPLQEILLGDTPDIGLWGGCNHPSMMSIPYGVSKGANFL